MFRNFSLILLLLLFCELKANDSAYYYLIYFKDKNIKEFLIKNPNVYLSEKAVQRRINKGISIQINDFPVNQDYINQIKVLPNLKFINASKWLNAVEIFVPSNTYNFDLIKSLPFVSEITFIGKLKLNKSVQNDTIQIDSKYYLKAQHLRDLKKDSLLPEFTQSDYNKSYFQNARIGIPTLHRSAGKMFDFHVAIFDAGFYKAYRIEGMEDLLDSTTIIKDFVDYDNSVWEDDQHGCNVLGFMKTYNPGTYIGSAPFAKYTLLRTENGSSETPMEELNWLLAAEFADSLGVDMIIASVGYHTFDLGNKSHSYSDLDGQSTIVAKAANIAYSKGIMVVSSSGNEGINKWHHISTPADAPGTLAIGACDEDGFHVKFSSVGPSADGRVKPDFLAPGYKVMVASAFGTYSGNGTSYSTPIFAGALANLMYLYPKKTNDEIRQILIKSATHTNLYDSAYGYGIPDFGLANCLLGNCDSSVYSNDVFWIPENSSVFQDMNIYFKSKTSQTVRLKILYKKNTKVKTIYKETRRLKAGEWYFNDYMMFILNGKVKKRRIKFEHKNLILVFESENGNYQRIFKMN